MQFMQDIGEFFGYHAQQMMSQDTYANTVGEYQSRLMQDYGIADKKIKVTPFDLLVGFDVVVRDGSIPGGNYSPVFFDLFKIIAETPALQQRFDLMRIFKHIARNSGAKNVDDFEVKVMPNEAVADQAQRGNVIPIDQVLKGGQGAVQG